MSWLKKQAYEKSGPWKTLDDAAQAIYHKNFKDLPDDGEEQDHVAHEFSKHKEQPKEAESAQEEKHDVQLAREIGEKAHELEEHEEAEVGELEKESDGLPEDRPDNEVHDEPSPEDYTITPTGPLGGLLGVAQIEGKFLGEFNTMDEAKAAIKAKMEKDQFSPNVWFVSDHGNWDLITL